MIMSTTNIVYRVAITLQFKVRIINLPLWLFILAKMLQELGALGRLTELAQNLAAAERKRK